MDAEVLQVGPSTAPFLSEAKTNGADEFNEFSLDHGTPTPRVPTEVECSVRDHCCGSALDVKFGVWAVGRDDQITGERISCGFLQYKTSAYHFSGRFGRR